MYAVLSGGTRGCCGLIYRLSLPWKPRRDRLARHPHIRVDSLLYPLSLPPSHSHPTFSHPLVCLLSFSIFLFNDSYSLYLCLFLLKFVHFCLVHFQRSYLFKLYIFNYLLFLFLYRISFITFSLVFSFFEIYIFYIFPLLITF